MRFIEDLITIILENNHHWWDRDLTRLALVSPGWLYHVRKRLYASPSISSFTACASLSRTLQSNPYLASLVQQLVLRPTRADTVGDCSEGRLGVRTLLGLEGLRSLTLGGELVIQSERFLGFVTAADTLTRLHIDGTWLKESLVWQASLEWSGDLIFRFPNLKSLRLSELEMDIEPPWNSRPLRWDELILENVSIIHGSLSHLVPDGSTLGRFRVKASSPREYGEHIRTVLYSSHVHSLEYELEKASPYDNSLLEPEGIATPHALCLRRLEMHGLHIDNLVLTSVRKWCPEIEEFIVSGRLISLSPEDWASYLTSGALPSLRCLRLTWGTNGPPYRPWNPSMVRPLTQATLLRQIVFLPL